METRLEQAVVPSFRLWLARATVWGQELEGHAETLRTLTKVAHLLRIGNNVAADVVHSDEPLPPCRWRCLSVDVLSGIYK